VAGISGDEKQQATLKDGNERRACVTDVLLQTVKAVQCSDHRMLFRCYGYNRDTVLTDYQRPWRQQCSVAVALALQTRSRSAEMGKARSEKGVVFACQPRGTAPIVRSVNLKRPWKRWKFESEKANNYITENTQVHFA